SNQRIDCRHALLISRSLQVAMGTSGAEVGTPSVRSMAHENAGKDGFAVASTYLPILSLRCIDSGLRYERPDACRSWATKPPKSESAWPSLVRYAAAEAMHQRTPRT